jgi:hypothetical protein
MQGALNCSTRLHRGPELEASTFRRAILGRSPSAEVGAPPVVPVQPGAGGKLPLPGCAATTSCSTQVSSAAHLPIQSKAPAPAVLSFTCIALMISRPWRRTWRPTNTCFRASLALIS